MATYPVIHKETGEQKEVSMSVHDWSQWCKDNPEWQRDWSDPSTAPACGEVGEWTDKLINKKIRVGCDPIFLLSKGVLGFKFTIYPFEYGMVRSMHRIWRPISSF